jgi:hypothetical protein
VHPLPAAHGQQQLVDELREGLAKVARAHLLDVVAHPARLAREGLELEQQDGLAHPAESRLDEAPLGPATSQTLEQHAEGLEVGVTAGELQRLDARAGRIGIQALVHLYSQT